MDTARKYLNLAIGEFLWVVILVPILAISWVGFYTIARDVGIPPIFAAGMSAAFDGIALFAARIGLKHRRKGFSGWLARITVVLFAALGAFVQSFHAQSHAWVQAHSWVVWSVAPIAAALAYELHLGWVHRKQLIRAGYDHPSAKSGFGPATWIMFPHETWTDYRRVLRARRTFIATSNLKRFKLEEAAIAPAPDRPLPRPRPLPEPRPLPKPPASVEPRLTPSPAPAPRRSAASKPKREQPNLRPVPTGPSRATGKRGARDQEMRDWAVANGFELGYGGRVPIDAIRARRAAQRAS